MRIEIKGPIISSNDQWIYDWFGIEATSPKKVNDLLKQTKNNEDLEVIINSPGGSVFSGSEIYTSLKSYSGNSIGKIVGLAASAGSVVAMGVKKLLMSPTAQMMIHNARRGTEGNYRDMEHSAEVLKNTDTTIANAYILKTGMKQEKLLNLMGKSTWLNAQKAKEYGFIDEIMFDEENQLVAGISNSIMLPLEVINKIRNTIENPERKKLEIKNEELKNLKERLSFKNKRIDSFLFYQKQGGINNE